MRKQNKRSADERRPSKKQVKQMIQSSIRTNDEVKYKTTNTNYSPSTAGTITHLTPLAAGTSDFTRVGDAVILHSIEVRLNGLCAGSVAAGTEINAVRMLLVQWHPVSNAAVAISDILLDNLAYWISPYDHDNQRAGLFRILKDVTYSTDGYSRAGFNDHWVIKGGFQKQMSYIAGSNTNQANGLYLIAVSDSSAISHPAVNTYTKVNFIDP